MSDSELEQLLSKWYHVKQEIVSLEKKCEKYKKLAHQIMVKKGENQLVSQSYRVIRRKQSRTSINKKSMPLDLWNRYSTVNSYDAYYVSKR